MEHFIDGCDYLNVKTY